MGVRFILNRGIKPGAVAVDFGHHIPTEFTHRSATPPPCRTYGAAA